MSARHAHALHDGISAGIGSALLTAHIAVQADRQARRIAVAEARSDANAVAAVRRLGRALRESQAREAALQDELAAVRAELARARGALLRQAR